MTTMLFGINELGELMQQCVGVRGRGVGCWSGWEVGTV